MKLFIDPADMKAQYAKSPAWLKTLMNAWADGLNYYLYNAPAGEAARDHALRAVDGADLQRRQHRRRHRDGEPRRSSQAFYGKAPARRRAGASADDRAARPASRRGSNGIAIAPSNTVDASRAAADQSAHVVLLPLRAADDERRRARTPTAP